MPDDPDPLTDASERADRFDLEPTRVRRGSAGRWVVVWVLAGCLVVSLAIAGNGRIRPRDGPARTPTPS